MATVINSNKFLVEEWENELFVDGTQNFIYAFAYTVGEGHGLNRENLLLILAWMEPPKFLIPINESGYLMVSW